MRRLLVATLVAALVVLPVTAAGATGKTWGNHYCPGGGYPFAQAYSTGTTYIEPPGSTYYSEMWDNGDTWRVRMAVNWDGYGGFWQVFTNGELDMGGTYAGCM